jgi:hypothetical protein
MFARISLYSKFLRRDDDARKSVVVKVALCVVMCMVVWLVVCDVLFRVLFGAIAAANEVGMTKVMARTPRQNCVPDEVPPRAKCDRGAGQSLQRTLGTRGFKVSEDRGL